MLRFPLVAGALLAAALASSATAANLVTNGDFEAGNSGFGSDYTFAPSVNQMSGYPEGIYLLDTNPNNIHNLFSSFGDHTTGSGTMMIVNGSSTPNQRVWFQNSISVAANTTYFFSTWIASAHPESPARLAFSINGDQIGAVFNASTTTGLWQQFFTSWNSGASTSASISLVNQNTAFSGNDFALDDISLSTSNPVPEPGTWALMITGFGAAGAMLRRRRAVAA